jgi:N-methylhydantoinase B/oxoprolinase/acetone carboxylase alpha subunit
VRNAVNAYADEMATALCKSAYNMMIYEVRDFCCGLLDRDARMISQNKGGLPIFLADLGIAVKDGIERYGLGGFAPGDVIMNHGRVCGQHLNNVVIYAPCFHDGEVVAFAASRAHWVDIGGMRVGFGSVETTEIYQEGLQFRSLKIYEAGKRNDTLWQMINDNLRFPEMNDQVPGPTNSGYSGGLAAARVAFKNLTQPQAPVNEGCFRALELILPEGKILNARWPAALGLWSIPLPTVIDTILKALAKALPERIPAAHKGDMGGCSIGGYRAQGPRFLLMNIFGGGWGGRPQEDGESAAVSICQGDVRSAPIELQEIQYPFLIEKFALRMDSGGAGKHRGGLGVDLTYRALQDCVANVNCERTMDPPWGLHGGKPGAVNEAVVTRVDGHSENLRKATGVALATGDRLTFRTAGGGGWGDPRQRAHEEIDRDVAAGYVSRDAAMRDYGYAPAHEHAGE